jgi:hypothetical protein
LPGEPELIHTRRAEFNGVPRFASKFNEPVREPLREPFCSAYAERLSEQEMLEIINNRLLRSCDAHD